MEFGRETILSRAFSATNARLVADSRRYCSSCAVVNKLAFFRALPRSSLVNLTTFDDDKQWPRTGDCLFLNGDRVGAGDSNL